MSYRNSVYRGGQNRIHASSRYDSGSGRSSSKSARTRRPKSRRRSSRRFKITDYWVELGFVILLLAFVSPTFLTNLVEKIPATPRSVSIPSEDAANGFPNGNDFYTRSFPEWYPQEADASWNSNQQIARQPQASGFQPFSSQR